MHVSLTDDPFLNNFCIFLYNHLLYLLNADISRSFGQIDKRMWVILKLKFHNLDIYGILVILQFLFIFNFCLTVLAITYSTHTVAKVKRKKREGKNTLIILKTKLVLFPNPHQDNEIAFRMIITFSANFL